MGTKTSAAQATKPITPKPSPAPEPRPSVSPAPSPAPEPAPRIAAAPPPPPPPPEMPRPPARRRIATEPIPAPAPAPAPSRWRELATDPVAREAQRASVRGEAAGLLEMMSGIAQGLPPGRPFAEWERNAIAPPLEETLYKYGGNMDPAFSLALALGAVAFMRWQEVKAARLGLTIPAPSKV